MRRTRPSLRASHLAILVALSSGISPAVTASESGQLPTLTEQDIADERLVMQALRERWARDASMAWFVQAPESEQKLWLSYLQVIDDGRWKLRDVLEDPREIARAHLQDALRQHGMQGDPGDYLVSLEHTVDVGDIKVPVSFRGSLVDACIGADTSIDFTQATVMHGAQAVSDAQRQIVAQFTKEPWCRVSIAERFERFKKQEATLQSAYAGLLEATFKKSVLEAKLQGHLTGGRDAWLKGLDIVQEAMDGSSGVEAGTLTLSTGTGGPSIALPQWLVFVRKDAQGNQDGVTLYRPERGGTASGSGQDFFQYLDIHRLGQAVAAECHPNAPSRSFRDVVVEAAGPGQEPAVQKFFDDVCSKPSSWDNSLQFTPYPGHSFQDTMHAWALGRLDLLRKRLESLAAVPELPALAARYRAVEEMGRAFNEQHVPTLREFTRRKEQDKLTRFFRKEKIVSDSESVDPDTITIAFNGRTMTWTQWVLEGYRQHGDNVFSESNNFMRDATLASDDSRIALRLNGPDVKASVLANLRSTYAGDDYIEAVSALLDPEDPRRQTSQDLRVAAQILGMQLAVAVERGKGTISSDDYRWLKSTLDALPGSAAEPDVEIAAFKLGGVRVPGIWVVSRKRSAAPDQPRRFTRESFVFVPEGPYGQLVYKEGPSFHSLLKTDAFKNYIADKVLTRDRDLMDGVLKNVHSPDYSVSVAPIADFREGCDEWLRDLLSDADEATVSRTEMIREQIVKGGRFATMGVCTAATGGAGVALCALGTSALMGMDISSAIENVKRGRKNEALLDVAFLWADALDVGQGLKAFNPKRLLMLTGKSHFSNVDEAKDALETAARQRSGFHPDGRIDPGFWSTDVRFDQLVPLPNRPGKATSGTFYTFAGKTYVVDQGRVSEVYSDNAWSTVRLRDPKRPQAAGAPVVHRQGRWQLDDGALHGGGKLWNKLWNKPSKPTQPSPMTFDYEVPESHKAYLGAEMRLQLGLHPSYAKLSPTPAETEMRRGFFDLRRQLQARASAELSLPLAKRRPAMPDTQPGMSQSEFIEAAFRSTDGLVIGEAHHSIPSKQLLIDNMPLLKARGVETVYLEHLLHDLHQKDLDAYFRSPAGAPMPEPLKDYLDWVDGGHKTDPSGTYTFLRVVEAAKQHRVRPVAIDVLASYMVDGMEGTNVRTVMMNFQAQEIINAYQALSPGTKWIALVGNSHANNFKGVPGVAELTGGIGVRVEDIGGDSVQSIGRDPGEYLADIGVEGYVRSDFLLEVPVAGHLPREARGLLRAGDFTIIRRKGSDETFLYHMSRDETVHQTPIHKDVEGFYILREAWMNISGRRYASIDDLANALEVHKGMSKHTPATPRNRVRCRR